MDSTGARRRAHSSASHSTAPPKSSPATVSGKNVDDDDEYYRKLEIRGRNMALIIVVYMVLCVIVFLWFQLAHVPPPLLVVMVPGFRADYLNRLPAVDTPFFRRTVELGSHVAWLRPAFPAVDGASRQLPLLTGAEAWQLARERLVSSTSAASLHSMDQVWSRHVPVWKSAVKQWRTAAVYGVPGACEQLDGYTVDICQQATEDVNHGEQLRRFLQHAVSSLVDGHVNLAVVSTQLIISAAEQHGCLSKPTVESVRLLDQVLLHMDAHLGEGQSVYDSVNVMIVSDGGLTDTKRKKSLNMAQLLPNTMLDHSLILAGGGAAMIYAQPEVVEQTAGLLSATAGINVFKADQIPAHVLTEDHMPPDLLVAADNSTVIRSSTSSVRAGYNYDLTDSSEKEAMHGVLVARGPSFQRGRRLPPIDARDVYPLLAALLDITPEIHAGSLYHTADMVIW